MRKKIDTKAIPKNAPVKKRNALLLNHFDFACKNPSITKGAAKTTHQPQLAYQRQTIKKTASNSIPTNSPVQRAQMGNCFPFQKKERAGRL